MTPRARSRLRITLLGALLAIVGGTAAGCASAPLSDPRQILKLSESAMDSVKSAHFRLDAHGTMVIGVDETATRAPAVSSATGPAESPSTEPAASAPTSPSPSASAAASHSPASSPAASPSGASSGSVSLAGSWAEGDVSLADSTAHLTFAVPGLGASSELVVVDGQAYVRPAGSTDWQVQQASDLPIDPSTDPAQVLPSIMTLVADPRLQPTLVGDETCGGAACYHVRETILKDVASDRIGAGGAALGDGLLDLWVLRDGYHVYRLDFSSSSSEAGTFAVQLVLTRYDESLSIQPPQ